MTAAVRAFGASGDAWFGGDVEDEAAELLGTVRGRGRYSGQAGGSGELGGSRAAAGEGAEERERVQRVRERREGIRAVFRCGVGLTESATRRSRRWRSACMRVATTRLSFCPGRKTTGRLRWWVGPGKRTGPALLQVSTR